jgi:hypothetical protein
MHDIGGPSPSPPCLNTIPKFMFDQFTRIRHSKNTLLENGGRCNASSPFVNCHRFVPN